MVEVDARPSKSWKSVSNRKGPLPRSLWRVVRRAVLSRSVPRGGVFFWGGGLGRLHQRVSGTTLRRCFEYCIVFTKAGLSQLELALL